MLRLSSTATVDVAVIGGGPAGCLAAWSAHQAGASVILIDKGYVGTSGAMAAGNNTISDTLRGTKEREATVAQRVNRGLGLVRRSVVEDVLDQARANLDAFAAWRDAQSTVRRQALERLPDEAEIRSRSD